MRLQDDTIGYLSKRSYIAVVSNESLRGLLENERLQNEILSIDAADDREKVMQDAISTFQFKVLLKLLH